MSSTNSTSHEVVGIIGAGALGQAMARTALRSGRTVLLANSRGPETLARVIATLDSRACAALPIEASHAAIVVLAVPWEAIPDAVGGLEWSGQVVIDATNDFDPVGLEGITSSEVVAELMPGARVVKAANTLAAAVLDEDPRQPQGQRVMFISGDDPEAKYAASALFRDAGFFVIDLGGLAEGGRLQQVGGPLPSHDLIRAAEPAAAGEHRRASHEPFSLRRQPRQRPDVDHTAEVTAVKWTARTAPTPASPTLSPTQIQTLAAIGEEREAPAGEILYRVGDAPEYPFIAITQGSVTILDGDGIEITRHGPANFLGELNLLSGQRVLVTAVVAEPLRYIAVDREVLRSLLFEDGPLSDLVLGAFIERREALQQLEGIGIEIIGPRTSPATLEMLDFARSNLLPFDWSEAVPVDQPRHQPATVAAPPLVRLPGGTELHGPTIGEVSRALGIGRVLQAHEETELLILGAGPAGLGAAVYAASEGLQTTVVDSLALGGQARWSRRIENYLGFPAGISGAELMGRAAMQARKFGASLASPYAATELQCHGDHHTVSLDGGHHITCRAVILATGAKYRQLPVDGLDEYQGLSVFYAVGAPEAQMTAAARVGVVGGGNSAGQAAVWLARNGALVTLIHRRHSISETMSAYLVRELDRYGVLLRDASEIESLTGSSGHLESVTLTSGESLPMSFLFLFLGARPHTGWLEDTIALDGNGFILTGDAAGTGSPLQTSVPGIYAAGDARADSVKRCASAAGEGAMAIQLIHRYLATHPKRTVRRGSTPDPNIHVSDP
jgi:thioredoxin reductase (NADPH)